MVGDISLPVFPVFGSLNIFTVHNLEPFLFSFPSVLRFLFPRNLLRRSVANWPQSKHHRPHTLAAWSKSVQEATMGPGEQSTARVYADVNVQRPSEYWDYRSLSIQWREQNDYDVVRKVGKGKYSEVFEGFCTKTNERCIIKILNPVRKIKIKREIKVLQNLCEGPNIVKLLDMVRISETNTRCLMFELFDVRIRQQCRLQSALSQFR